jgi:hypothetical protein
MANFTTKTATSIATSLEKQAATRRLCEWETGFVDGFRGNKRQTGQGPTYLHGFRAGARNGARIAAGGDDVALAPRPHRRAA